MIHTKPTKKTVAGRAIIRVIRKGEIDIAEKPVHVNKESKKAAARRMASTILDWITEFETRKLEETRLATERFQHL